MQSGVVRWALVAVLCLQTVRALPSSSEAPATQGVVGARKLATSNDCVSVVAFAGTGAHAADSQKPLAFSSSLLDKGVGWSKDSGEFTCHCPGLYQFSFSGGAKLTLKKQTSESSAWTTVVATGAGGGANTVLLDMEIGDKAAVWLAGAAKLPQDDDKEPTSSFSGYRIAKK